MASVPCPVKISSHLGSSSKLRSYKQCSLVKRRRERDTQVLEFITCVSNLQISRLPPLHATKNSPRGFGTPPKKTKKAKKQKPGNQSDEEDDEDEDDEDDRERGVIPEIVTNRMISRMGFTVGLPLFIGLLFFPLFYYLKVGLKIDVPTWVPFIVSFVFFGTALAGVSYGIVSSSWDPLREGSLLGWNEAKKNWPVFWQSFWNSSNKR
uniref:Protein PAM68, chloroplastic n=1 Tax=Noccaea caerulescens TaxID=107243 RepID=A0A1J3JZD1_NOCCA